MPNASIWNEVEGENGVLHVEHVLNRFGREVDLVLPTVWGDAVDLHRSVTNLHAREGQISRTDDPGKAKVQTICKEL